jgi:GTP pyrophosphokinase
LRIRLEDLSFRYVMPTEYEWVKDLSEQAIAGKSEYIERLRHEVEQELTAAGVPFLGMTGRVKHLYSLYKKLLTNERDIVQVHDLVALRIMVPDVGACYATLGIIHQRWKPLKGLIKDYIALPKPNGYRSLHTTVFCEEGEVVEFQIRTPEMHEEAERGIAAHWRYDEAGKRSVPQPVHGGELSWVKELGELEGQQHDNGDLADRLDSLKIDAFQNRIFVFTPSGDVIDLPEGATPVDFAYAIHSGIGDKMSGARVNDDIVSVETPLASGDCCEIIIDKNRKGPNPDWLEFVKTSHARDRIRAYAKAKTAQWINSVTDEKIVGKR